MATHAFATVDIWFPGKSPADVAARITDCATDSDLLRRTLANWVASSSIGFGGVGLVARARGVTAPSATASFTVTASSITVGDKFILNGGPNGPITFTAVANGTENPFLGQYAANGSDANFATSLRLAINSYAPALGIATAAGSTNTVALTATIDGAQGNSLLLVKQVTTAGVFSFATNTAFTGGINVQTSATNTITVGTTPVNADTLRIGNVVLTWVAAAANENQITISGTTGSATNLAAAINAHSILSGLVSATVNSNAVTVTAQYPDLVASQLYFLSSTANVTVSGQLLGTGVVFTANSALAATSGVF